MGTGQSFIVIGALALLSTILLRINNTFVNTNTIMMENRFNVLAVSLANSVIEEATGKAFDENSISDAVLSTSGLSNIGPDSETYPNFDDFDDFNNFTKVDSSMKSAVFKIKTKVGYINPSNPDKFVSTKTWHKKIDVEVTSISMSDTIRMSSIYSYFYFR